MPYEPGEGFYDELGNPPRWISAEERRRTEAAYEDDDPDWKKEEPDKGSRYRCVNGHDRCDQMYPGPDCPYCEEIGEYSPLELLEVHARCWDAVMLALFGGKR